MYKAGKEQVSVFGLRTQFGGGKTTGFALVYDSPEAMKKFEPHYRLVRVGLASKIEKPSRQQREWSPRTTFWPRASIVDDGIGTERFCVAKELSTDHTLVQQASSARTDRRPSAERRRSRAPSPRRRNRWLALFPFGSSPPVISRFRLVEWLRLCALLYDNATLDSTKFETTSNLEFIGSRGVTAGFWLHSIQYRMFAFEVT